jgi:hypothetical protein
MAAPLVTRTARLRPPESGRWQSSVGLYARSGQVSLVVDSELVGSDVTVETYAVIVAARLRLLPGSAAVESETIELAGVPASLSAVTFEPAPGSVVRQLQLSWVSDGHGWNATASARVRDGFEHDAQLRALAELAAAQAINGPQPTDDLWQTPREAWNEVRTWF